VGHAYAAVKRPFTVADDIRLTLFGNPAVTFSPDLRYFVVETQRGLLKLNRPESALRIFRTGDVIQFLRHPEIVRPPLPVWIVRKASFKNGPIITSIRWLPDSRNIAFLAKTGSGNDQLVLADLKSRTLHNLTPEDQHVTGFDIRDAKQFVYSVLSSRIREKAIHDGSATHVVATGRSLDSLIFPEYLYSDKLRHHDLSDLWAVTNGRRFRVRNRATGRAIPLHSFGQEALALSPDGHSVVTALGVSTIPPEWETLYPPSMPSSAYRIRAGKQEPEAFDGIRFVSEYVRIDLDSGTVTPLTHAPLAHATGWWGLPQADWSFDGKYIALSNTFLPPAKPGISEEMNRPCGIAVVSSDSPLVTCLEHLKGQTQQGYEDGYRYIAGARFCHGNNSRITVDYLIQNYFVKRSISYIRFHDGTWKSGSDDCGSGSQKQTVDVSVRQGPNTPPFLVATESGTKETRDIWDPNPELKGIQLSDVTVFKWKDKVGRAWTGGLYRPPGYAPNGKYPLVIQTHGFDESAFSPAGIFPTANAAQELAAVGVVVLQVHDCPIRVSQEESACQVAGYEAAVEQLSAQGLVDSERVGIIGFSRTCYYVLSALTTSSIHFKAASITDGIDAGYMQYLTLVDAGGNENAHATDAMIGAAPFGDGLQQWFRRSPAFNMSKVTAPLQVVALGLPSVLQLWEPYAALRFLNKPVDLNMLVEATHVLTNPGDRMISQGGTVDWFRFWLKGEEDSDEAKAGQYARWREMRNRETSNMEAARREPGRTER